MVPYITALIVLIVAILFMVYKRVDGFEVASTTLKPTDTLQSVMKLNEENLKRIAAIKKALKSVPEDDDVLTPAKLDELGIAYTMVDGKVDLNGMESTAAAAPSTTPIATKEIEDRIAKSVATQVKDTLLSHRSTSNPADDVACPYASYDSTATSQGQEYRQVKPAQAAPDMSEYIRKDSIPCWNCSLP